MEVSLRQPRYTPQNSIILIVGTPKRVSLLSLVLVGNLHNPEAQAGVSLHALPQAVELVVPGSAGEGITLITQTQQEMTWNLGLNRCVWALGFPEMRGTILGVRQCR